ncbi:IS4 family transposase [Granulosicoccus sp. 3-233]|uniref:IS4 family transposase n=2 Tax=Granulosicoccus sp. 3-233 TaxID=3417969 RepID=UPI003D3375CA
MGWASEEFETIDLGDKHLDKRAVLLAEQFSANATKSIPDACGGWAETRAAYRFVDNPSVDFWKILGPHIEATEQRMRACPVVLCLQDTTTLDFNGKDIDGLGPLQYEPQRGLLLHPTYVVTPQREPLGLTDSWHWAREFRQSDGARPSEICESQRWIDGYERIAESAASMPDTRCIYVGDRESDMMPLMRRAAELGEPVDWLVRAKHDRALPDGQKLFSSVSAEKPIGQARFHFRPRRGVKARDVIQQLYVKRVVLAKETEKLAPLEATCLICREINTTEGVKPIEWRLLTNRSLSSAAEAAELVDWYRARWEIEMYFDVLKNGCKVESLQLRTLPRLEVALALFMIVAWRINRLMRLGRNLPDVDASLLFEQDEIVAAHILNKKSQPEKPPTLNQVVRLVAMAGGFLGRKSDGEPGAKTIWQGMERVLSFTEGMRYIRAQPETG